MKYVMVLALMALAGCAGSVPVELEVANAVQRQAAEAIERDYQNLVDASTAEIERMGLVILDAEIERRWHADANEDGLISLEQAKAVAAWAQGERDKVLAARDAKRKQLAESPNLEVMRDMNQALRDYLVSVGGAMREIERLIGANVGGQNK